MMTSYSDFMRNLFSSSFIVLTSIAILCGVLGALVSGMWDFVPPAQGIYSFGNYFDGAIFGAVLAAIGLIPYWIFHMFTGIIRTQWKNVSNKKLRIVWIFCWATFLGVFFSKSLVV